MKKRNERERLLISIYKNRKIYEARLSEVLSAGYLMSVAAAHIAIDASLRELPCDEETKKELRSYNEALCLLVTKETRKISLDELLVAVEKARNGSLKEFSKMSKRYDDLTEKIPDGTEIQ